MKLIKITMELGIEDDELLVSTGYISNEKDKIADYLNQKLYSDPEWFGEFGPENIIEVKETE
jgi:hypothetical protein